MSLLNLIKKKKYDKIIDETIADLYKKDEDTVRETAQLCKEIGLNEKQTTTVMNTAISGSMKNISKAEITDAQIDTVNQMMIKQLKKLCATTQNLLIAQGYYFNDVLKNDMLRYISYLYVVNACDQGFVELLLRAFNVVFASDGVVYSLKDINKCLVTYDLTGIFQGRYFAAEGPAKLERFVSEIPFGIIQISTLLLNRDKSTMNLTESMLGTYLFFQMILTQIGESYSTIYSTFYTGVNNYNYYILEYLPDNKNTEKFNTYCTRINAIMHKYEKT